MQGNTKPDKPLTEEQMIKEVQEKGGEYTYTTIKGKIDQDTIHRVEPCQI